jgi:hypothetical protein
VVGEIPEASVASPKASATDGTVVVGVAQQEQLTSEERLAKLKTIFRLSNPNQRLREWLNMMDKLTAEDIPKAFSLIRQGDLDGRWYSQEHEALWERRGDLEGEKAIEKLNHDGYQVNSPLRFEASRGWARTNPEAALAYLSKNYHLGSDLIKGVASGLAEAKGWRKATDEVLKLLPPQERVRAVSTLGWAAV